MVSEGSDNIVDANTTGTDLVMTDLALRDTVSYTGEPSDWTIYFHPGIRFGSDSRVIGYFDLMVPVYLSDTSMLFVNPRFSHDSDGGHEWNLGGGYRHILWDDQLILGINAYYDVKKHGDSGYMFDQWGMGFEAMGEFNDVMKSGGGLGLTGRFNFYVPLTGSKFAEEAGSEYAFRSLGIYTAAYTEYEPLSGLDYEMGMRIPYLSEYVETWVYAGGYHYWGRESGHMDGFVGRLEVIPADFVALDFEYRNDNFYGDEFYGEVKVEIPFSIENLVRGENPFEDIGGRMGGSRDLAERMVEPVRRDIDIRIEKFEPRAGKIVVGLIEEAIFVSEGATAGTGDGSFENPYASIDEAILDPRLGVTAFIIHVINDNGGDGVAGGGDFTGIGPIAGLDVWGSGAAHPVYGIPTNMTSGFPEMNSILIVDDAGAEIMGIHFNPGVVANGLYVDGAPGILIHNNRFTSNGIHALELAGFDTASVYNNSFGGSGYGLLLNNGSGAVMRGNTFAGDRGIEGISGTNISITGNRISVENYGIGFFYGSNIIEDLAITGNSIAVDALTAGFGVYLETPGPGTDIGVSGNPVVVSGNTLTARGGDETSGVLFMSGGELFADISNNVFWGGVESTGRDAFGIRLEAVGSVTASIEGNAMPGGITAVRDAFGIALLSTTDDVFADIINNDLTGGIAGSSAKGIYLASFGDLGISGDPLGISGNDMRVTASSGAAMGIELFSRGDLFADVVGNDLSGGITGPGVAYGIELHADFGLGFDGTTVDPVIVNGNLITVAGDESMGIVLDSLDSIFSEVTNNIMTGGVTGDSLATGIYLRTSGTHIGYDGPNTLPVLIDNNTMTITATAGDAFGLHLEAPGSIFADITNNNMSGGITGNSAYGINLYSMFGNIGYDGAAITPVLIDDNAMIVTGTTTSGYGVRMYGVDVFADVTNNDMTRGITGPSAYGMSLFSQNDMGAAGDGLFVSGNDMRVTGTTGAALGIQLFSYGDLFADVVGNDLSGGITGPGVAYGIELHANGVIGADGASINPVYIYDNTMIVSGDQVLGIALDSVGSIFASVSYNDLSGGITGESLSKGIYLNTTGGHIGYNGLATSWVPIEFNRMTVTSTAGDAYGLHLEAPGSIFAGITGNNMSGGITGNNAYGTYLYSSSGSIGSSIVPVLIDNTAMTVTGATGGANGILLFARDDIFADITNNNLTGGITGETIAYGIAVASTGGSIGYDGTTNIDPVLLDTNSMVVTSHTGSARGIFFNSPEYIFTDILNNDLSGGITGETSTSGIALLATLGLGYYGTTIDPVVLDDNDIAVTSNASEAFGIFLSGGQNLFADITSNDLTGGIIGNSLATGIHLMTSGGHIGSDGANITPILLEGNSMTVTTAGEYAYGLNLIASGSILADITSNDLSGGITGNNAYGINMASTSGGIGFDGASIAPVLIDDNIMTVTGVTGGGYGTLLLASGNVFSDITNNDLTGGITGETITYGIAIASNGGSIGYDGTTNIDPLLLDTNSMVITSHTDTAWGVYLTATDYVFTDIINNDLTGGITGETFAYGIGIFGSVGVGYYGATIDPVELSNNDLVVTSNTSDAMGMVLFSGQNLFSYISNNDRIDVAGDNAYGAFLNATSLIGSGAATTLFENNSGTIHGDTNRYMLRLTTGSVGGGSDVRWNLNAFTPTGGDGTWDGNYDAGDGLPAGLPDDQDDPIWTNFGAGDFINP